MKTNPTTMTIADYCAAFNRNEVRIDTTYQRSPEVWPPAARSYLIETILKGLPIPKLALHQVTDLRSKQTVKYVIDGQQRSSAIRAFYNNDLRLSRSLELAEAANHTYAELSEGLQDAFLSYLLNFDQFEAAADEDVREYFRRINSFTAPLNPEEHRHAQFQGPMKWFINSLRGHHGEVLLNLGVLAKRSVVRMADIKLLAEIVHALIYGVTTTNKRSLDSMYRFFDKKAAVDEEEALRTAIGDAVDEILKWPEIRNTALMKTHVFYSLVLATILVLKGWPSLTYVAEDMGRNISSHVEENLLKLAGALEEPEVFKDYQEFTAAAEERTNVKAQREKRIVWLARAMTTENSI